MIPSDKVQNIINKYDSLEKFNIVQMPISLYDQRLIEDGTINFLANKGYQIHARSIFLQGLIVVFI